MVNSGGLPVNAPLILFLFEDFDRLNFDDFLAESFDEEEQLELQLESESESESELELDVVDAR